ncbi:hypothetical protein DL96DRAFT_1560248 [Flagelloscypha sp. PMI_526]|nr:hypothetical protein DL96DRAFT_1560248 [Flagelloscypha sp. PMI_526]
MDSDYRRLNSHRQPPVLSYGSTPSNSYTVQIGENVFVYPLASNVVWYPQPAITFHNPGPNLPSGFALPVFNGHTGIHSAVPMISTPLFSTAALDDLPPAYNNLENGGTARDTTAPTSLAPPHDSPPAYENLGNLGHAGHNTARSEARSSTHYVIFVGTDVGIYFNYEEAIEVARNNGTIWQSYPTFHRAAGAWEYARERQLVGSSSPAIGLSMFNNTIHRPVSAEACASPLTVRYFYSVSKGIRPGVYGSWLEAGCQVIGQSGSDWKKFPTWAQADAHFARKLEANMVEFL